MIIRTNYFLAVCQIAIIMVFLIISAVLCFFYNPVTSDKGFFESGNVVSGLAFGLLATLAAMVTGWLDDRSKDAWNEYLKGALDFAVSLIGAFICVHFFGTRVYIAITHRPYSRKAGTGGRQSCGAHSTAQPDCRRRCS